MLPPFGLLLRGVLHAVWRLGQELKPLAGDRSPADHAPSVAAQIDPPKRVGDVAQAGLEQHLGRKVELAQLGCGRGIGRMLVATAIAAPESRCDSLRRAPVSYTHLTQPTICSV